MFVSLRSLGTQDMASPVKEWIHLGVRIPNKGNILGTTTVGSPSIALWCAHSLVLGYNYASKRICFSKKIRLLDIFKGTSAWS
ncbi:hypothetical protein WAI453_006683 [Rhynchosporium graminicola]